MSKDVMLDEGGKPAACCRLDRRCVRSPGRAHDGPAAGTLTCPATRRVSGTLAKLAKANEHPARNWRRTNIRDGRTRAQPKIDGAFHKKFPFFVMLDEIFLLAFCLAAM
ncbi:hypothetical protein PI93_011140 [Pandoraea fibrosis]|uniref:Uncharacterized protein n=1 Tax=Pandoraea fibrosis TaxID=1891094 RepID=A0ABX6HR47_9BURK|nr:hypothetical protein [Pandoraea fibrosis]QHE93312.1 hypothetical protein PJ20_016860 [Pandoraea fibrosis]QHF13128.1 hypothetical protein PI93_011140 [Pandoraea fibrosis]